jgi:hypothetical protein
MTEATKTATAAPARKRTSTPAKKTAAPAVKAVAEPEAEEAQEATESTAEKRTVTWEYVETTKTYEKFKAPAGEGCVGNIYAPLGTKTVKTLFVK